MTSFERSRKEEKTTYTSVPRHVSKTATLSLVLNRTATVFTTVLPACSFRVRVRVRIRVDYRRHN